MFINVTELHLDLCAVYFNIGSRRDRGQQLADSWRLAVERAPKDTWIDSDCTFRFSFDFNFFIVTWMDFFVVVVVYKYYYYHHYFYLSV